MRPRMRVTRCYGIYVRKDGFLCWDSVAHERKTLINRMRESGLTDREWRKIWVIRPVIVSLARKK